MPMFRPNPHQQHLTDYWNALNRNAPDDELVRLASLVAPTDRAAIERARALHQRRRPDPVFVARLETTLMNAFPAAVPITARPSPIRQPTLAGRVARDAVPGASTPWRHVREIFGRHWQPALGIALVVLLIVTSLGGVWLFNQRNDNTHVLAPPDATPTTEASPDVPMYRGNPERTGVFPGPGIEGDPVELWQLELGGSINTAPAIVSGVLYVGVGDGNLHAFDAATGASIWTFTASSAVASSPAVVDGIVYVGSEDGMLYALDAVDGSEVWTFRGSWASASVAVVDGVVYTGSEDGVLHALDAATGEERWQAPLGDAVSRSPAMADGVVYIGSVDGVLHTFDAATGEPGWTFQGEGGGILATTAIGNGLVYQTMLGGVENSYAYALDPATGEVVWRFAQEFNPGIAPAAVGTDLVYLGSADDSLYAVDAQTGEEIWRFDTGANVTAAPALVGDTLYVGSRDQHLYALDAATGAERWNLALMGEIDFGPVITGGVAYVGTTYGFLYAIGGAGTTTLAALTDATPASAASPVATPEIAGDLATFLWATNGGPDSLDRPADVTIAPDGNIWVADGGNSRFQIFSPDGEFVEAWGTFGDGEGEFNFVRPNSEGDSFGAVAFAPDGTFYVADMGNQRIQHFDANRQFLHAWGEFGVGDGQFISPIDVAVDSQGNVFVDDDKRNDIQKFAADGTFILKFGGLGSGPGQLNFQSWLAIDADDNVWVPEERNLRVQQFDNDGQFVSMIDGSGILQAPYGIAVDAQGRIFLADIGLFRIVVLAPDGGVIGEWGPPEGVPLQEFANIALDGEGNAYIVDYLGGTLVRFQLNPPLADESVSVSTATLVATPVS